MSCNETQNERSGKDLLLKICEENTDVSVATGTSTVNLVTASAHGLAVGDMVRIGSAALGTVNDLTADQLYFVKTVVSTTAFTISTTPGGTAIVFDENLSNVTMEFFKTIGGIRSGSLAFASEAIDITNYGSNQWRAIKDGAGLKTVSVSGDGVYNNTTNFKAMEASAFANTLVCLAFLDVTAGRVYHGCFKLVSLEAAAEHNGEATFTMGAESSGTITIFQAA